MPRVIDHEERRNEVLAATWKVVATEGLEAATIRRIAIEVGCTAGLVTHHFANKDEILVAALRQVHVAAARRMASHLSSGSPLKTLYAVLLEVLPLDDDRKLEWRVWIAFWGQSLGKPYLAQELHNRYSEWRNAISGLMRAAQRSQEVSPQLDVRLWTDITISLIDGLGLQAVLEPQYFSTQRLKKVVASHMEKLLQDVNLIETS
ncbi:MULTISPECIES: TetR/AcrR family transcriptional regulator [Pseudomonas]|jgi:AcrR family transcriptional regulator|uniref:TetR family transcriptional regulator C-terminal domain-containing protein n=1 Tax=Pseudomonas carnis TaxID=2487355 RepID=A0ABT5RLX1_9PSED|nr:MULTISPECIES: TetR family transcriptional regulator C-terminal domain-containing protein [Pseudomonas]MBH3368656.1 TetR family transcriptional regulator [Pseudomonas carnis]MDD1947000.1 TetR family transcriptional regulator C-terminal domain-containing protein [Pseudomonas carnis]MDI3186214.1 TetR family transcriptional regulator C-terminal domain-containing protein [Pseudomonas paracarnis]NMZ41005.1 TetR family transcriptional regulator [Pseudomonas proteolytica]USW93771.1 TetR family tran